ncbi:MAG: hypothetical protein ACRDG6_13960, partial [Candidatus Limnocylindria bacterium]
MTESGLRQNSEVVREQPTLGQQADQGHRVTGLARDPAPLVQQEPPGRHFARLVDEFARSVTDEALLLRTRIRPGTEVGASPLQQLITDAGDG